MRVHASCAAYPGPNGYDAILLTGPAGAGKSDMLLRLIQAGWVLVADDQVLIEQGAAAAPDALAGILEVRGLGLFRTPFLASAALRLVVRLGVEPARLPAPRRDEILDLPLITIDPGAISAVARISLALEAACGRVSQLAGAFAM
jgi:HPr kinase/phosphorylase